MRIKAASSYGGNHGQYCRTLHRQNAANRRATNVTLPEHLLADARDLGIRVSQACERGLAREVAETKTGQWLSENRAAMDAWNKHVGRDLMRALDVLLFDY